MILPACEATLSSKAMTFDQTEHPKNEENDLPQFHENDAEQVIFLDADGTFRM